MWIRFLNSRNGLFGYILFGYILLGYIFGW